MLFSEPKIPQSTVQTALAAVQQGFSALQRAENSSMVAIKDIAETLWNVSVLFSEPKIPQFKLYATDGNEIEPLGFSALQRAENSSILQKCFFRSRVESFSALQRAENSSKRQSPAFGIATTVSVLFSEPKIPQSDPRTCVHPYFRPR